MALKGASHQTCKLINEKKKSILNIKVQQLRIFAEIQIF